MNSHYQDTSCIISVEELLSGSLNGLCGTLRVSSHLLHAFRAKMCICRPMQVQAAKIILVALTISKQNPISCGHPLQLLCSAPPAGANVWGDDWSPQCSLLWAGDAAG